MDETFSQDFAQRCQKFYEAGARYVEWRSMFNTGPALDKPNKLAIDENAYEIAKRAAIVQKNGLVPIFKPEILVDGPHDIKQYVEVTERVLAACIKALIRHCVMLEGTLLKLNMVTPGSYSPKVALEVIAEHTVRALMRTLPAAVPAVVFSSGGQSEEDATLILNAMRNLQIKKPWPFSFSFGDELHRSILKVWAGREENVHKAQKAFLFRCRANSQATAVFKDALVVVTNPCVVGSHRHYRDFDYLLNLLVEKIIQKLIQ
ncbi:hypothetical protein PTKIN_Ptkin08bG0026100 [Pterospermum kingtungense]